MRVSSILLAVTLGIQALIIVSFLIALAGLAACLSCDSCDGAPLGLVLVTLTMLEVLVAPTLIAVLVVYIVLRHRSRKSTP